MSLLRHPPVLCCAVLCCADDREQLAQRHKALPEPGRCADRIEDFFTVLSGGWNNSWQQHSTVFRTMLECLRSEEGCVNIQ
jgi:hypothetical protein